MADVVCAYDAKCPKVPIGSGPSQIPNQWHTYTGNRLEKNDYLQKIFEVIPSGITSCRFEEAHRHSEFQKFQYPVDTII